jgi:hypothetical protein
MDSRLGRSEALGALGGALLALGVFLPWYATNSGNRNAVIDGERGSFSAWDVHPILRWLLLAAAVAPFILAYIVLRDRELSWPRGEMTAVVAIAALGLILYVGLLQRPGQPSGEISLRFGWFVALLGAVLMLVGGASPRAGNTRPRKPPGVM